MEKKQYELCHEILRRFYKHGLLENIILIGSWCILFYKNYFHPSKFLNEAALNRMAIDLLEGLIDKGEGRVLKKTFNSVPSKWQKQILKGLDDKIHRKILLAIL
ncbi:hypothetical protein BVX98_05185 [bacterium F11]|nr:hypothetical protein BVX98_05185 [bacterium F11]